MEPWIEYLERNHIANIPYHLGWVDEDGSHDAVTEVDKEMCRRKFLFKMARPIVCVDGFKLSIQASMGYYSSPRFTLPYYKYTHFEVQAADDVDLCPYEESYGNSIHPQVPRIVITRCINAHGGIADEQPFNEYFDSNEEYFEMLAETDD